MNNNKIKQFMKNYGFYVAVGLIAIGAVVAVFVLPNNGKIQNQADPYAEKEQTTSTKVETERDHAKDFVIDTTKPDSKVQNKTPSDQVGVVSGEKAVVSQNFDSTTAQKEHEPFFAEGDTLSLPIQGKEVVPYTDDSTKHWFSESLGQTMRTYGICIAAKEGSEVKAAAKGTVVDIIDDSSSINGYMPSVGLEVVIEHGNGIQTKYGLQNGKAYKDLLGKVVETGDPIGEIGKPSGAFLKEGSNVYFQVLKEGQPINPVQMIEK